MSLLFILCLMNSCVLHDCLQHFKISHSGALLSFRTSNLLNQTWEVAPAEFGYKKDDVGFVIDGKVEGFVILPANENYHTECTAEPEGTNPYIQHIKKHMSADKWILIIDRYNCSFVNKVAVAQKLNASAAIVCDSKSENVFPMAALPHWIDNITIPSVLLSRSNCETLMHAIGVKNWDVSNPESILYPSATNLNYVFAVIEWGLTDWEDLLICAFCAALYGWWMLIVALYMLYEEKEFIKRAQKCIAIVHEYSYHSDIKSTSTTIEFITNKSSESDRYRIFQKVDLIGPRRFEKGQTINMLYDPDNPLKNKEDSYENKSTYYIVLYFIWPVFLNHALISTRLLSYDYITNILYLFILIGPQIILDLIIASGVIFVKNRLDPQYIEIERMRVATQQEILMFEQRKMQDTTDTIGEIEV